LRSDAGKLVEFLQSVEYPRFLIERVLAIFFLAQFLFQFLTCELYPSQF